jgi:hypothetical protein
MLERTNGVGVDAFVDASGVPKAISQGFKYLRKGGKVVLVGLPSEPVTLDLVPDIVFREATVFGIHGRRMFETWTHHAEPDRRETRGSCSNGLPRIPPEALRGRDIAPQPGSGEQDSSVSLFLKSCIDTRRSERRIAA